MPTQASVKAVVNVATTVVVRFVRKFVQASRKRYSSHFMP
jgi:hypothetical protein